jgi:hypothetical protein
MKGKNGLTMAPLKNPQKGLSKRGYSLGTATFLFTQRKRLSRGKERFLEALQRKA